jgi:hypothetical protein
MPKAEGDSRSRDVAEGGPDAGASSTEPTNVNHGATTPDDIPPVHVLEAAQRQDRKETEDLLAGFDRPGREPKLPAAERDFVDHYLRKKDKDARASGDSGAAARASSRHEATVPRRGSSQKNISTVILPRKSGFPPWGAWAGAAVAMLLVGGAVAYVATSEGPRGGAGAATGPSAATTITAATSPTSRATSDIPPPPPASETAPNAATTTTTMIVESAPVPAANDVPPPRASGGRRDPRAGSSGPASTVAAPPSGPAAAAAATHDRSKPPPRDDFIRDL